MRDGCTATTIFSRAHDEESPIYEERCEIRRRVNGLLCLVCVVAQGNDASTAQLLQHPVPNRNH